MKLNQIYDQEELKLLADIGILLENKDYTVEEMEKFEDQIIEYINRDCVDGEDNLNGIGLEYEQILEKIIDFEDGEIFEKYNEGDEIELKDGRIGIIVDITNEAYTVNVNSEYQIGDILEDIPIVEVKQIYGLVNKKKRKLDDDMHEINIEEEYLDEEE